MKIFDHLYAFLWFSPMANNCNTFLIEGKKNILVDPGHYHLFGHVKDGLSGLSLSPGDIDTVVLTHVHSDHSEGIKAFEDTHTKIAMSGAEMEFVRTVAPHYGKTIGGPEFEPDISLEEGDIQIGDLIFQVIPTPGHSPGSICLYWPDKKVLFSGDVIFSQGIGRTDLVGGNGKELKESIKKISSLQVDYLLPGHGDILAGSDLVKDNFKGIEDFWFAYL